MTQATLTKVALSFIGQLKPDRVKVRGAGMSIELPPPQAQGGMPLMEALSKRRSQRGFSPAPLKRQDISNLLWAAFGVNRPGAKGRTAHTARDAQEIDVYAAMREGVYIYDPFAHKLRLAASLDARNVTGYEDFVDEAPLDLVYVADHKHIDLMDADQRMLYSGIAAGAIAQNVYLYCAAAGLATVVRGWLDRKALGKVLGLTAFEHIIAAQTIGYPA